jgi:signal transduction histidine kinase
VDRSRSHLHVAVSDNGRGFDTASTRPSSRGLRNMANRAQRLSGDLTLRSTNPGAEILWSIPL